MSDTIAARWICTMMGRLHVKEAVKAFAGVTVWLNQHSCPSTNPKSSFPSSRIVADARVTCDSAEELGENAVRGIMGISFANVTLKRKTQVFILAAMEMTIAIDKEPVVVNPNQLFHCIVCVVRSADDLEDCLQYELV
ncbi:hypothetical protein PR048_023516 [Dryococelus australis]|uniref:Uncharacterized protein n=1 Tax=Dryococelus australis TaxID=614101 RepID=A0ABQ9GU98_9NEOP|nr:hypothetical protein PR048_023516 [Dryococelus australis]